VSATRDLERGSRVADYRIDAVLGRGGVSVVYLAEDQRLKRRVALKLLAPALAADERFRERFLRESELAASLDHANVIPIYEAGEADGSLFIAMRYVEGSDLKALLRDGPLTPERAVVLAAQVAGALDAAHRRGLVHGDVKPSNVLIDSDEHAYLADFGLTKRLSDPRAPDGEAQLMGTIDYVAPEQIRGEDVDGRADVYSLGCLLHECLTGRQPFKRGNDAATLYAHLEEAPPQTHTPADPVLARALAKTPDERYETCTDLVEAAREALGVARPRRSRLPVAVAAVAVAIAAGSLAAFLALRDDGSGTSTLTGRLVRVDGNRVTGSVRIGADPSGIAAADGHVWVTARGGSEIWVINERTLGATRIPWPAVPAGIATAGGIGYVLDGDGSVERIDLDSPRPLAGSVQTPAAEVIAGGPAGIWAAGDAAVRIATVSEVERVLATALVPQPVPPDEAHVRFDVTGIAVGSGAVWVAGDALDQRLFEVDPTTSKVVRAIPLSFPPSAVAAGAGAVWVADQLDDEVAAIDPATGKIVAKIPVGREPMAVAVGPHAVWVANALDGTLSRIDPTTRRLMATVAVGDVPRAIAADGSTLWVAADER
jgi:YVTN family beta-propeller protein